MKKYVDKNDNIYFVGNKDDIKATYRSILKHSENIKPLFCNFPRFSKWKNVYVISIGWEMVYGDYTGYQTMSIITSDQFLNILLAE